MSRLPDACHLARPCLQSLRTRGSREGLGLPGSSKNNAPQGALIILQR
jgi:hypothetical protein